MSKSTTIREALTTELEAIRKARETEEQKFKAALEKLYADHRKAMADLKTRRENAWKNYSDTMEAAKPAPEKPAKKETKKPAKKPAAKKVPAKTDAEPANG